MGDNNHSSTGLSTLLGRLSGSVLRSVNARVELLAVELQEEGLRVRELVARIIVLVICGTMGTLLLTATIIFLFPASARLYVTGALAFLYLCGAAVAGFGLRAGLKREPFTESIDQVKKDRAWLETLKISELEARKRALVSECELWRATLKSDVEELRLYGVGFFRKFDRARSVGSWVMLAGTAVIPLIKLFQGRKTSTPKPGGFKGTFAAAMVALRLYRKYGPVVRSLAGHFLERRRTAAETRGSGTKV